MRDADTGDADTGDAARHADARDRLLERFQRLTGVADGSVDEGALAAWLPEHSEDRDA